MGDRVQVTLRFYTIRRTYNQNKNKYYEIITNLLFMIIIDFRTVIQCMKRV